MDRDLIERVLIVVFCVCAVGRGTGNVSLSYKHCFRELERCYSASHLLRHTPRERTWRYSEKLRRVPYSELTSLEERLSKGSLEKPAGGFGVVNGKNPVWFFWTDVSFFDLLAYERDNQHPDEAGEDPENGHVPQEQGLPEADPESDADVCVPSSGHDTWQLTRQKGSLKVCLTPCPCLPPDRPVISSAPKKGGLHDYSR